MKKIMELIDRRRYDYGTKVENKEDYGTKLAMKEDMIMELK